jgi:hypothetical protein
MNQCMSIPYMRLYNESLPQRIEVRKDEDKIFSTSVTISIAAVAIIETLDHPDRPPVLVSVRELLHS